MKFARFAVGLKNRRTSGIGLFGFWGNTLSVDVTGCLYVRLCGSRNSSGNRDRSLKKKLSNSTPLNDGLKFNVKFSVIRHWMFTCNTQRTVEKSSSD
jgi:hypothetical protein